MTQAQAPEGLARRFFHPNTVLWSKHNQHHSKITALIESCLTNEDGVVEARVERHRIVAFYSPLATDLDGLEVVVQKALETLAQENADWEPFPFLETGKSPLIAASDAPVSPAPDVFYSRPLSRAQLRSTRRIYSFNGWIMELVEGELDEEAFAAVTAPLEVDLKRLKGIVRINLARGQLAVTYTTELDTSLLDDFVTVVMQRFFEGTPETVFASLKQKGHDLKLMMDSVPN